MDTAKSSGDMDHETGKPDAEGGDAGDAGESLTKAVTGANAILTSKNSTSVGKKITFQEELPKIGDSLDTTTEESTQKKKNPMLLSPIIRCLFGFLDIKDVKKFRFVSREWNSAGRHELTSRTLIRFGVPNPNRLPIDFYSCFLNSAALFSSFQFFIGSWKIEELSKFFDQQQKSIKKLEFSFCKFVKDDSVVKNFDISPWISKSPMVKSDVKYLTKLKIFEVDCAIPLSLLKNIKDLSLSFCRVNVEAGIQIHPVKLSLRDIDFYQDETLSKIQINDIVNFSSAKEIYLNDCLSKTGRTRIAIDLRGNCGLDSLTLVFVDTVNCKTSKWNVQHMEVRNVEFPPITQMIIKELYLFFDINDVDISSLPRSIEKLGIHGVQNVNITCSEPTTLEKLKYISAKVKFRSETDFSYLDHFRNCPQLTHLKFHGFRGLFPEIKLPMIPKTVKTLTLDCCTIDWPFGSCCYANIEKLVFFEIEINFERISKAKISVDDIIFICDEDEQEVPKSVFNFFNYQNPWSLCKRFYIGKLKWDDMKLEDSVLNEHVDTKSAAFYVFEKGEKGRALNEKSFYQLSDIPKHINLDNYMF